jgi:hypothetical protein
MLPYYALTGLPGKNKNDAFLFANRVFVDFPIATKLELQASALSLQPTRLAMFISFYF